MSNYENYLISYRTQNQNTIERNSKQHPTFLKTYQKRIEIVDWTLERYRSIQQQEGQFQQNDKYDLVMIKRIIEELYERKKITRNNITKSEIIDETAMYRLEERTIEDILSEIGEFIHNNKNYLKLL